MGDEIVKLSITDQSKHVDAENKGYLKTIIGHRQTASGIVFNLFSQYLTGSDNALSSKQEDKSVILGGWESVKPDFKRKQVQAGLKVARAFFISIGRKEELMAGDKVLRDDDTVIADALELYLNMAVNKPYNIRAHSHDNNWEDGNEGVKLAALICSRRMIYAREAMLGRKKLEEADRELLETHFTDRATEAIKFLVAKDLIKLKYTSDNQIKTAGMSRSDGLEVTIPDSIRNAFKE